MSSSNNNANNNDKAKADAKTDDANSKAVSAPLIEAIEEDDDFEEFEHDQWGPEDEDKEDAQQWQDNWDDDDIEDDFTKNLRAELSANSKPE